MKRSQPRNQFLNTKSDIDRKACNKQRNLCVGLIRREKKNFFTNISTRDITDNKTFWKTVKPLQIRYKPNLKLHLLKKKLFPEKGKSKKFLKK